MNPLVLARLVAVVWAAAAIWVAVGQGEVVPVWIVGMVARAGGSPEFAVRLVAGIAAAVAGILLAFGSKARVPALVACVALVFSGIADVSARWSLGSSLLPSIAPIIAGAVFAGLLWRSPPAAARVRHPGIAGVLAVLSVVIGAAIAANLEVATIESPINAGRDESGRYIVHDISPSEWEGLTIEETGLLDHLPAIRGLVQDQPTLIAFYRPNCGACHDLFDMHFGERLPARIVAVRVPPAEGVELTDNDLPEDVTCADCVRLAFPDGPVWLIQTPALVEVVDGRVTCVSTEDFHRCVDDAVAASEALFAAEREAAVER